MGVTGGIRTKFIENLPGDTRLPKTSLYYPVKQEIEAVISGAIVEKDAMDVDDYVRLMLPML